MSEGPLNETENESDSSFQMSSRKENDDEEDNNGEEVFESPTDHIEVSTLKERLSLVSQVIPIKQRLLDQRTSSVWTTLEETTCQPRSGATACLDPGQVYFTGLLGGG